MTEVFLGNPPWSSPGYYGVRAGSRWPHLECQASRYMPFPFFLAYATALLEKHGFRVRLVDAIAEKIPNSVFIHKMINSGHDLIVLETSTPSFENDLQLVTQIRRMIGDEPKIALCGPNNLMISKEFLEGHSEIDYVLRGEYEETLLELVQSIDKQTSPHKIRGLNFRDDSGKTTVNPDRPLIKNLDSLPWPSRHQLPMMAYYDEAGGIPQPSAQLWASRGCPYMCIFCVWPQLVYGGANYRVRKPRDVVD
ncbi:cobalamin-dependent protein, partial [bacterium]|nr:cobalamin-dependent protein [candidate division CSSED10-310 bacterium]